MQKKSFVTGGGNHCGGAEVGCRGFHSITPHVLLLTGPELNTCVAVEGDQGEAAGRESSLKRLWEEVKM